MPKTVPPHLELKEFHTWLTTSRGVGAHTAYAYSSHVRSVLRKLGTNALDPHAVSTYFNNRDASGSRTAYNERNAWSQYVAYAATLGVTVPKPEKVSRVGNNHVKLPANVRSALRFIRTEGICPMKEIPLMTWAHVRGSSIHSPGCVEMVSPLKRNIYYLIRADHLDTLREYAQPREPELSPLIPTYSGGMEPLSHEALILETRRLGD